ncbi:MAG: hypothetical protein H7318_08175 [Oligoflexus sp.]|nr:hypothetical protein [Oligoflexus sp.]
MHAKNIIIDGQVAMITGANVQLVNDSSITKS